ncbi:MAG: zinc ribbon domain-containing protein [Desulfobacterales bacterium]|jgi:putative FmdB family regulatory protein|nr:zinc ribbon domain-containing protein [Desulfobacterales bacterium]
MPIFEFRCGECNECFEILVMNRDEEVDLKCPQCASVELERIISKSCYAMGESGGKGKNAGPSVQNRSCSGGSCTTWELPGHAR